MRPRGRAASPISRAAHCTGSRRGPPAPSLSTDDSRILGPAMRRRLPKTVYLLGLASLLNDASSDIIYPLLPIFLSTTIGAGPAVIGLIEGAADAISSILKLLAGSWSDRTQGRKPFVVGGYGLSGLSRLLLVFASHWGVVFGARLADRTGKGIRSAPRDALIVDVTDPSQRGRAFGLHRAFDHLGAVAGPLAAAALLAIGFSFRQIFLVAVIPTAAGILLLALVLREPARPTARAGLPLLGGKTPPGLRSALFPIALFSLANASDMFLILQAYRSGVSAAVIPLLWAANHAVKALLSTWAGDLSDRRGRGLLLISGWALYAVIYAVFPFATSLPAFILLFVAYAVPLAMTEGTERAWVAERLPAEGRGKGFGIYYLVSGFATLGGSLLFGVLFQEVGPPAAFFTAAALAMAAALVTLTMERRKAA